MSEHYNADSRIPWRKVRPEAEWIRGLAINWDESGQHSTLLKKRYTHRIVRLHVGDATYYAKRYRPKTVRRQLRSTFFGDKAWWEWRALIGCERRGIEAPRALAYGRNRGLIYREGYLLIGAVPGISVYQYIQERDPAEVLGRVGQFVADLHRRGVFHNDLDTKHILVTPEDGHFRLIDLDGAYFPLYFFAERRAHNLFQVMKSLPLELQTGENAEALLHGYREVTPSKSVEKYVWRKLKARWEKQKPEQNET